jgi:flavin-dependent dehydrogenase
MQTVRCCVKGRLDLVYSHSTACLGCETAQFICFYRESSTTDTPHRVIHRHDYHAILLDEAKRLGATVVLGQHVTKVDVAGDRVVTNDGTEWVGDVIVGADGRDLLSDERLQEAELSVWQELTLPLR